MRIQIACVGFSVLLLQAGCANVELFAKGEKPSWEKKKSDPRKDNPVVTAEERPATPKTMYAYARVLAAQGKDSDCDVMLSRVLEKSPRQKEAYLLQAEVRVRMRRGSDAITALRTALRYYPRDPVILNNLGMCLLLKSECSAALACFTDAAAVEPINARYRSNMALSLGLLGREEESSSLYRMVISDEDTVHNVAVLNSARLERLGHPSTPSPARINPPPAEPINPVQQSSEAAPIDHGNLAVADNGAGTEPAVEPAANNTQVASQVGDADTPVAQAGSPESAIEPGDRTLVISMSELSPDQ